MVTCICITHNRVDYLSNSIDYFNSQTYPDKELVILFENDPATKEYLLKNLDKYNYLTIEQEKKDTLFYIYPLDEKKTCSYHIQDRDEFYIKTDDGFYVTVDQRKLVFMEEAGPASVFSFYSNGEQFIIKSKQVDLYLTTNNSCVIDVSEKNHTGLCWSIVTLLNNTLSIVNELQLKETQHINNIGWKFDCLNQVKSNITFCELNSEYKISLGAKRNLTIHLATGEFICVWDDDDVYHPDRIKNQMWFLNFSKRDACSLNTEIFKDNSTGNFYISPPRSEGWENSLICRKSVMGFYDDLAKKEDTPVLLRLWSERKLTVMDDPYLYVYNIHSSNISGNTHFKNILKTAKQIEYK